MPSPLDVAPAVIEEVRSGQLLSATLSSLQVFAAGYALAIVTGVALGVLMGGMPRLGETLEIYVNALNSTPRVAFIPLIILWFGLFTNAKIVVVWFQAVMPILINTYAGVQNTDPDLVEAARSFGARRGQVFRFIMLPAALPYIVTGLRLGAANAMVGTVIAELYTALSGLGVPDRAVWQHVPDRQAPRTCPGAGRHGHAHQPDPQSPGAPPGALEEHPDATLKDEDLGTASGLPPRATRPDLAHLTPSTAFMGRPAAGPIVSTSSSGGDYSR